MGIDRKTEILDQNQYVMVKNLELDDVFSTDKWQQTAAQWLQRGFAGIELVLPDIENRAALDIFFAELNSSNIPLQSLTTCGHHIWTLTSDKAAVRREAIDCFEYLIEAAGRYCANSGHARCGIVRIASPDFMKKPAGGTYSYEASFNHLYAALKRLCRQAEVASVMLLLENPSGILLLSPLELRELIDALNSPYLGLAFNPTHAAKFSDPLDWLNILEHNIHALCLNKHFDELEREMQRTIISRFGVSSREKVIIDMDYTQHS